MTEGESVLPVPQLLKTLLADPEKVGDLVDDGDLDFALQLGKALTHLLQGPLENVYRVRIEGRRCEEGVLLERCALIKAQQRFIRGITHLIEHLPGWALSDSEDDVYHSFPDFRRDAVVRPPDRPVELLFVQLHG
jgi:hypothetical protein